MASQQDKEPSRHPHFEGASLCSPLSQIDKYELHNMGKTLLTILLTSNGP